MPKEITMKLNQIKLEVGKSYQVECAETDIVKETCWYKNKNDGRELEVVRIYEDVVMKITISNEEELKTLMGYDEDEGMNMTTWEEFEWLSTKGGNNPKLIKGSKSDYDEINGYELEFWDHETLEANGWSWDEDGCEFYGPIDIVEID